MSEVNDLLWIDLETTGSDETFDEIIEIACIITSNDLSIVRGEFSNIVVPSPDALMRLLNNDYVRQMHNDNGLLAEIGATRSTVDQYSIGAVDTRVAMWIDEISTSKKLTLAGSGVAHFDSRFIRKYMKRTSTRLNYFTIDTGVIRRAWREWVGTDVSSANEGKTHRAMDDIRCHLEEAREFKAYWNALVRSDGIRQQGFGNTDFGQ